MNEPERDVHDLVRRLENGRPVPRPDFGAALGRRLKLTTGIPAPPNIKFMIGLCVGAGLLLLAIGGAFLLDAGPP